MNCDRNVKKIKRQTEEIKAFVDVDDYPFKKHNRAVRNRMKGLKIRSKDNTKQYKFGEE